ncbi:hypothetical protein TrVFT333_006854 [Trichoderma virens FT-333]|nr:hypothetical protein TrVFT333_006854 [Trichoderma virens FT-333]
MAPSVEQIRSLLEAHIAQDLAEKAGTGGKAQKNGLITNHFHDNVEFHINGHDFQHATQLQGADTIKSEVVDGDLSDIPNIIDYSKPHDCKVLQVIGGGPQSDWAAAVLKATATTLSGKPFNHESVMTFQFDNSGKILHMKTYADTLHIHNAIQDL